MKIKIIIVSMLAAGFVGTATAQSTSGGAAAGASGAGADVNANAGVNANAQGADAQGNVSGSGALPPGLEKREQLPPGLGNRDALPPGLSQRTNTFSQNTNGFSSTNQFGSNTNGSDNLSLTGRTNANRQTDGTTNRFETSGSASSRTSIRSQGVTQMDQTLATRLEQAVQAHITSTAAAGTPVHFRINNGVVRLLGTVPSEVERQRIVTIVQQTPGVVRVVDELQISARADTTMEATTDTSVRAGGSASLSATNNLSATSTRTNLGSYWGTNQFQSGTNGLSPTSRTNNLQGLPPGLEKRDELPPGLQNRDQLPPGLERRTNSAGSTL